MSVFVFGSNLAGRHAGGAARHAFDSCGAIWGQGIGRQGESYALPTMDEDFRPLPLERIREHAADFCMYARAHPDETFELTRVGCGIAGFTDAEIAPLFADAPVNVQRPDRW